MNIKKVILIFILFLGINYDVYAENVLECEYTGEFFGANTTFTIKLDDKSGFSRSSTYWTLDGESGTDLSSLANYVFSDAASNGYESHVNLNASINAYTLVDGVYKEKIDSKEYTQYFVKNNKWACPQSLTMLHDDNGNANFINGGYTGNWALFLTVDGKPIDESTCLNNTMIVGNYDYVCNDYTNPNPILSLSKTKKAAEYKNQVIDAPSQAKYNSSGTCCLYKGNGKNLYIYKYNNSAGSNVHSYAVCVGNGCFTNDPTNSNLSSPLDSSWSAYHQLSDCSKMPPIYYKLENGKYVFSATNKSGYSSATVQTTRCDSPKYDATSSSGDAKNNKNGTVTTEPKTWSNGSGGINSGKSDIDCPGLLGDAVIEDIGNILKWIKIAAPILVIILGSLDFAKAAISDDQKALSKAGSTFIKRMIAAVVLFFVPSIIMYIIEHVDALAGGCPLSDFNSEAIITKINYYLIIFKQII